MTGLAAKIVFVGLVLLIGGVLAFRWALDPWNSHGHGKGWECDATRGGAVTCAKDLPADLQAPRKPN